MRWLSTYPIFAYGGTDIRQAIVSTNIRIALAASMGLCFDILLVEWLVKVNL